MPADAFHEGSRTWIAEAAGAGEMLVPTILPAEVAGAAARRTGDRRLGYLSIQQRRQVPARRVVGIDNSLVDYAAELASRLQFRGAGATYVAVARRLDIPLVTLGRGAAGARRRGSLSTGADAEDERAAG